MKVRSKYVLVPRFSFCPEPEPADFHDYVLRCLRFELFQSKTGCDEIHLWAKSLKFLLHDCKSERVKRSLIQLKVIDSPDHRPTATNVFIRKRRPIQVATESFTLVVATDHVTW